LTHRSQASGVILVEASILEQEPLARVIGATRRRINQAVTRRLRAHRLNPQRFWVLVNLMEMPGSTLRELARRLHMDEPSASRIVANLTRRRLVSQRQDAVDRRRRNLELTAEGQKLARTVAPIAREVRRAVEAGFSDEEKETLRRLLRRVVDNVAALEGPGAGRGGGQQSERRVLAEAKA
jgi:MarR family transcriptional regulator, organic hydroperoxide resistance regulator